MVRFRCCGRLYRGFGVLGRKSIVLTLCAIGLLASACNSAASVGSRVVVWSGGLAPHSVLRGVVLDHGKLTPMSSMSDKNAQVRNGAVVHPSKAALAVIDAAVKLAAAGKAVAFSPLSGGMYATVAFSGAKHGVVGFNADTPGLAKLIAALNQVLGKDHQLFDPVPPSAAIPAKDARDHPVSFPARRSSRLHADLGPTDFCRETPKPWKVDRELSLQEAARMGLVTISAGGSGNVAYPAGSAVVIARYARINEPIRISETIQIIPPTDQPDKDYSEKIQKALDSQLKGYKLGKGKDAVPVQFNIKVIPGSARNVDTDPCMLTAFMNSDPKYRSGTAARTVQDCRIEACYGIWSVANTPSVYAHEVLHSLGLPDAYHDCFQVKDHCYPLPYNGLDGPGQEAQLASALEKYGVTPNDGKVVSDLGKEDPNNAMADSNNPKARILPKDLKQLTRNAGLRVQSEPGTVLLDKRTSSTFPVQFGALVTGHWDISVKPAGTISTRGVVWATSFATDGLASAPVPGDILDVLDPQVTSEDASYRPLTTLVNVIVGTAGLNNPANADQPSNKDFANAQAAVYTLADDNARYASDNAFAFGDRHLFADLLKQAGIQVSFSVGDGDPGSGNIDDHGDNYSGPLNQITQYTDPAAHYTADPNTNPLDTLEIGLTNGVTTVIPTTPPR